MRNFAADARQKRLQGCFISDEGLETLVAILKHREGIGDMEELLEELGEEIESEKRTQEEDLSIESQKKWPSFKLTPTT